MHHGAEGQSLQYAIADKMQKFKHEFDSLRIGAFGSPGNEYHGSL